MPKSSEKELLEEIKRLKANHNPQAKAVEKELNELNHRINFATQCAAYEPTPTSRKGAEEKEEQKQDLSKENTNQSNTPTPPAKQSAEDMFANVTEKAADKVATEIGSFFFNVTPTPTPATLPTPRPG